MKESYLASVIINYFEKLGYEAYKEVISDSSSRRSDCFFVRRGVNGEIEDGIVVETKIAYSLKVFEQAAKWKAMANRVFIGVPKAKRKEWKLRKFGNDICKNYLKIGVIEVDTNDVVYETVPSEYNSKPKYPTLYEEQKLNTAGDKGKYFTPFKRTISLINEYLKDKDKIEYKILIENIDHHYASKSSASQSLKAYFGSLIIGYLLVQEDKLYVKKNPIY
jgi:hypothetical protein